MYFLGLHSEVLKFGGISVIVDEHGGHNNGTVFGRRLKI